MEEQYHFVTNEIDTYFHKDPTDIDKYVVCTCAKNEDDYIEEFVQHYLNLNFDKIIICDNNDNDNLEQILKKFIKEGTVEIFNCRGFNSFQVQFYSMFCAEGNYKWCAYYDCDEFLHLNVYTDIKEFLNTVEGDVISFNWMVYGTNGKYHKEPGTVQERFPEPVRPINIFKENCFIKSIVRGGKGRFKDNWFNGSHTPTCSNNDIVRNIGGYHIIDSNNTSHSHLPARYKYGYLKHYYTKSFDEWINKSNRGWPDGTVNLRAANFHIMENHSNYPIENFKTALFIDEFGVLNTMEEVFKEYSVVQFNNTTKNIYSWYTQIIVIMSEFTDKTFIVTEEHIDDNTFNIVLEYAIATGNRLVYCRNHAEVWKTYLRYSKYGGTYYIIDLR